MGRKLTTSEFIEKARAVHGNRYNYSNSRYVGAHTSIIIECPFHGPFEQKPTDHVSDRNGCPQCKFEKLGNSKRKTLERFVNDARAIHGSIYDYSTVIYKNARSNITIICKTHGTFEQTPDKHLQGRGCRHCARSASSGEMLIAQVLDDYKVEYITEATFIGLVGIGSRHLRYDFYVPHRNVLIEYDGIQHFYPKKVFAMQNSYAYKDSKRHDMLKDVYAVNHQFSLLRLPYTMNSIIEIEDHVTAFISENPKRQTNGSVTILEPVSHKPYYLYKCSRYD